MKILFIGNSHTYVNDMPAIFLNICKKHGVNMQATMLTRGGIGFENHAEEPQTRFNILFGEYDYVVLQHRAHPMGDLEEMKKGADKIIQWIRQAGSQPVFYQTWAKKGDENFQKTMSGVYDELGKKYHAKVAPVGNVWQEERKKHPDIEFYAQDGEHASLYGSTLAAAVIFKTIFSQDEEK